MRKNLVVTFALLSLATLVYAGTGGSTYSIFGIGDLRYLPSTRSVGMGYTGLGLPSAIYINTIQPAAWSRINRVRLDAGLLYEGFNSTDGTRSLYLANSDFSGALIAIPISPSNGIVTVMGFTPFSNVSYQLFSKGTQEGVDYQIDHTGTGGVSRGLLGLSYQPSADLSFGASFNYLFGSIDNASTFTPTNTSFYGGTITETMTLHAITVSIGGMFNGFGRISKSLEPFSLGVVVTTPAKFKTQKETKYTYVAEFDTIPGLNDRITIPVAYGIGLGYQPSQQYLLAADYYAQAWGNAEFNGIDPTEIRNYSRWGIGAERLPGRDAESWFGRLAYRLGFYGNSTYYRVNGEPINEWGVTGGLAIPLFGDAKLNTAFEYGSRGTTNFGLVKDKIFRISFSVSLSELWFQRYEED